MSEIYSFKIAAEAFGPSVEGGKKQKDCSAKHHKVDLLETECRAAEAKETMAAKAAAAALDEYRIWQNDASKGPQYYQIYRDRCADWSDARSKVLKLTDKLHSARHAAWNCEASNYAG